MSIVCPIGFIYFYITFFTRSTLTLSDKTNNYTGRKSWRTLAIVHLACEHMQQILLIILRKIINIVKFFQTVEIIL